VPHLLSAPSAQMSALIKTGRVCRVLVIFLINWRERVATVASGGCVNGRSMLHGVRLYGQRGQPLRGASDNI
jgi:hypothetical protein